MKAIRSHYMTRRICFGLVFVILTGLLPIGLTAAVAQETKTVLVFPVTVGADTAPSDIGERATGALAMAIDDQPGLDALQFIATSPSVRRAVAEGRVRQVDVEEGTSDVPTAIAIGHALQADYIVMSSVQSFTRKDDPASVELIFAGQMYDVAANLNPATGEPIAEPKVFRAFGVSGASTVRAHFTGPSGVLAQEAVRDAAAKGALTLAGRTEVVIAARAKKPAKPGYKYALLALLVAGLLIAVNSGSGGGAHPVTGLLPPRNVTTETLDGTIRVSWQPPTGSQATLIGFFVYRAVDSTGQSGDFVRIDEGLDATRTFFEDTNLLTGTHVYQYKVVALYNTGVSAAVPTGAVTVTK